MPSDTDDATVEEEDADSETEDHLEPDKDDEKGEEKIGKPGIRVIHAMGDGCGPEDDGAYA